MNSLEKLQAWYHQQCDGDWEHAHGIRIDTVDNPGWSLSIDLANTALADKTFAPIEDLGSATEWSVCKVENQKFIAHGGSLMLSKLIETFLGWAGEVPASTRTQA